MIETETAGDGDSKGSRQKLHVAMTARQNQRPPGTHKYHNPTLPDQSTHPPQPVEAENGPKARPRPPASIQARTTQGPRMARRARLRSLGGGGGAVCSCARSTTEWHEHRVTTSACVGNKVRGKRVYYASVSGKTSCWDSG